jgi:hypothetical protein
MADGHEDIAVTVGEEIQCLLAAGWAWDGDKLVHPTDKNVWTAYQRTDSSGIGARIEQFESELKQAVREARKREQGMESGGDAGQSADASSPEVGSA